MSLEDVIRNNEQNTDRIIEKCSGHVIINNRNGVVLKSTVDNSVTQGIKQISGPLVSSARSAVRDLDSTDDLAFMRMATKKYEILIAPEDDFTIVAMQKNM